MNAMLFITCRSGRSSKARECMSIKSSHLPDPRIQSFQRCGDLLTAGNSPVMHRRRVGQGTWCGHIYCRLRAQGVALLPPLFSGTGR
jgi:hypothetical protein